MRPGRLVIVALLVAVACAGSAESGQTGSALCSSVTSCPCDIVANATLIEGALVDLSEETATIEVIQNLTPGDVRRIDPGMQLTAGVREFPECSVVERMPTPGDHVLALFPRTSFGLVWMRTWADAYDLGAPRSFSLGELVELNDAATCNEQYPPPPEPPCDDTPAVETSQGCNVSP